MSASFAPALHGLTGEDCLDVRDGRLFVEDVPAVALARRFGTPLHVISERQLRANARAWHAAAGAAWPHGPTLVMPSLKANTSLTLRRILNDEGMGCDAFGRGELALALRAGVPPARISLNGATKPDELLRSAVAHGVRVTIDSFDELERVRAIAEHDRSLASVRLRVRPWLPTTAALSDFAADGTRAFTAVQDYRAGIPDDEFDAAVRLAHRTKVLELTGLMAHVSRQTTDLAFWQAHAEALGRRAGQAADLLAGTWTPRELDVGGGFAIPRDPTAAIGSAVSAPTPREYAEIIAEGLRIGLRDGGLQPTGIGLELEPGRAVYGNAGVHLARVLHVKRQSTPLPRVWIETDTSEAFLADVVWEHARFAVVLADEPGRPLAGVEAAITGTSCGFDVLAAPADRADVVAGEVLAFLDTGAYQDATASNFNAMGRPATVLVTGADARVIKRAETLEDLLAREVDP
jgi:diaminopimelate decarboxylase